MVYVKKFIMIYKSCALVLVCSNHRQINVYMKFSYKILTTRVILCLQTRKNCPLQYILIRPRVFNDGIQIVFKSPRQLRHHRAS